jgi:hypothetical protein
MLHGPAVPQQHAAHLFRRNAAIEVVAQALDRRLMGNGPRERMDDLSIFIQGPGALPEGLSCLRRNEGHLSPIAHLYDIPAFGKFRMDAWRRGGDHALATFAPRFDERLDLGGSPGRLADLPLRQLLVAGPFHAEIAHMAATAWCAVPRQAPHQSAIAPSLCQIKKGF